MKIPTKKDKLEYAVYSAIQFLNGSSKRTTDQIYSLLLEANELEEKYTLKKGISDALRRTGKYKSIKIWSIKSETDYTNKTNMMIEVSCNKIKKRK